MKTVLAFFILLIFSEACFAKPFFKNYNFEQKNGKFSVNLNFDEAFSKDNIKIDYFSNIIQLSVPNAIVMRRKEFSPDNTQKISKIMFYQFDKSTMRIRIVFDKGIVAKSLKDKFLLSMDKKQMALGVQNFTNLKPSFALNQKIEEIDKKVNGLKSKSAPVKEIVYQAGYTKDFPKEATVARSTASKPPLAPKKALRLDDTTIYVSLAALLFGLFGLIISSFLRKKKIFNSNSFVSVSDEYKLGAFQKLIVVEIEGYQYIFLKNIFKTTYVTKVNKQNMETNYLQQVV